MRNSELMTGFARTQIYCFTARSVGTALAAVRENTKFIAMIISYKKDKACIG